MPEEHDDTIVLTIEQEVLTGLLCDASNIPYALSRGLTSRHFYSMTQGRRVPTIESFCFDSICSFYHDNHTVPTLKALREIIEENSFPEGDRDRWEALLHALDFGIALDEGVEFRFYLASLLKRYKLAGAADAALKVSREIKQGDLSAVEETLTQTLLGLQESGESAGGIYSSDETALLRASDYNKLAADPECARQRYFFTNVSIWDNASGGFKPGELVTISGRPAVGKSMFLMHLALQAYLAGKNVVFATSEMSWQQQQRRFDTMLGEGAWEYNSLRDGCLSQDEAVKYQAVLMEQRARENRITFLDQVRSSSTVNIEMALIQLSHTQEIDILFVDQLNSIRPSLLYQYGRFDRLVAEVVLDFRRMANKFSIPVVMACQDSRAVAKVISEGGAGGTEELAETDEIGRTSDAIFRLYQKKEDIGSNLIRAACVKMRDGDQHSAVFAIDRARMKLEYIEGLG